MHDAPPAQSRYGMLTDAQGMTLYVFDKDAAGSGKSVCNGPPPTGRRCSPRWDQAEATGASSAATTDAASGPTRAARCTTWSKDQKPGDTTGDGFLNNQWHTARP
jgi:predicted lipoprotein with Yx(FWY)xxD motif